MPRPARFTVDQLLDAAATLVAADGPAALTMSAVARAVGAPSGSMYHRFATRAELCGALWLRTEERFQTGLIAELSAPGSGQERCVAGARHTVRWCRSHPDEARVLLAGADALERDDWPADLHRRRRALHEAFSAAVDGVGGAPERVAAALVDVPGAVVRRYLIAGQSIPDSAEQIVVDCARALVPGG